MTDALKLVECPVCEGEFYVGIFPDGIGATVKISSTIRVWHNHPPPSLLMRCPLCYGTGKVSKELYSAFFLVYGDTLDIVWYKAVNVFRQEFNKSRLR